MRALFVCYGLFGAGIPWTGFSLKGGGTERTGAGCVPAGDPSVSGGMVGFSIGGTCDSFPAL